MQFIYIADPMCSWCYGFSPEIKSVRSAFKEVPIRLVMGGLRPFNTEKIDQMKDFLRAHWEQVHERSAQPFNYAILDDSQFIYDTEPPARAVVTVRRIMPEIELDFFRESQKAFYWKNRDTSDVSTFLEIIDESRWDIDHVDFIKLFESEEMKAATKGDFKFASLLGVQGFPALILNHKEKYLRVSRGYESSVSIINRLNRILDEL